MNNLLKYCVDLVGLGKVVGIKEERKELRDIKGIVEECERNGEFWGGKGGGSNFITEI